MNSKYSITQEVVLPSKGFLNPEIPGGIVEQRCLMVSDQKYLAGSKAIKGGRMNKLLQETCVSPDTFDVSRLTLPDLVFLMFKLRILSYGPKMTYTTICPVCGNETEVTLDLSSLEVKELEDDYEKHLEIVLPRAGDTVYTRILNTKDLEDIKDYIKALKKKVKDDDALVGIEYEQRLTRMIRKIVLKEKNEDGDKILEHPVDITKYVAQLPDIDATAIIATVDNLEYGVIPTVETVCESCGNDIKVPIRFSGDFFRPKYDTRSEKIDGLDLSSIN